MLDEKSVGWGMTDFVLRAVSAEEDPKGLVESSYHGSGEANQHFRACLPTSPDGERGDSGW